MEFCGDAINHLSIDERMTICNMAIEAGAKNGIIGPDEITLDYVKSRTDKQFKPLYSDNNAEYCAVKKYDLSVFKPCVAQPHSPDNYAPARELKNVKIDGAYIGSCTGGKISDFIAAASLLQGKRVKVDTFLVPATSEVAGKIKSAKINHQTLEEIFNNAGCLPVAPPSCAACLGGPDDTFGRTKGNEVVISTTNRNFIGRMGSKAAKIYLASPLTTAASAMTGKITDPREFM
jgi:3-isopropylmalate/(R)-2-methylmalate dehydratase large subunit